MVLDRVSAIGFGVYSTSCTQALAYSRTEVGPSDYLLIYYMPHFTLSIRTSPVTIAEVGEAPHIAKSNSIPDTCENKLDLVSPVATFDVLISFASLTRHSTILLKEEDYQLLRR